MVRKANGLVEELEEALPDLSVDTSALGYAVFDQILRQSERELQQGCHDERG